MSVPVPGLLSIWRTPPSDRARSCIPSRPRRADSAGTAPPPWGREPRPSSVTRRATASGSAMRVTRCALPRSAAQYCAAPLGDAIKDHLGLRVKPAPVALAGHRDLHVCAVGQLDAQRFEGVDEAQVIEDRRPQVPAHAAQFGDRAVQGRDRGGHGGGGRHSLPARDLETPLGDDQHLDGLVVKLARQTPALLLLGIRGQLDVVLELGLGGGQLREARCAPPRSARCCRSPVRAAGRRPRAGRRRASAPASSRGPATPSPPTTLSPAVTGTITIAWCAADAGCVSSPSAQEHGSPRAMTRSVAVRRVRGSSRADGSVPGHATAVRGSPLSGA